ncbi:hypothetical protein [Ruminococcus sp.]|uniref:hypothetical protein n=1 Tax=Ruminococcus sp. TaxID=41978 RepID=UPI0025DD7024|nr:hypothetical protein [Ruminococcus sp.]
MYLTVKQKVKHLSKEEYSILRELCHTAKNLANEAIYNVRQNYFTDGEYLLSAKLFKVEKFKLNEGEKAA